LQDAIQIKGNPFAEFEIKDSVSKQMQFVSEEDLEKIWSVMKTFRRIKVCDLEEYANGILNNERGK
jgi:predicted NUDIX family phosphoesterase